MYICSGIYQKSLFSFLTDGWFPSVSFSVTWNTPSVNMWAVQSVDLCYRKQLCGAGGNLASPEFTSLFYFVTNLTLCCYTIKRQLVKCGGEKMALLSSIQTIKTKNTFPLMSIVHTWRFIPSKPTNQPALHFLCTFKVLIATAPSDGENIIWIE